MENLSIINEQEVLGKQFRVYGTIERPLFLAKDVANWIEHNQVSRMMELLDDEEKLMCSLSTSGQKREMWFLTEDGLYEVLMQSRKPIARQFKKKVKEILKSIRQNGAYIANQEEMTEEELVAKAYIAAQNIIKRREERIAQLESNISEMRPKVEYHDEVLNKDGLITATTIAKDLGLSSAQKLNKILNANRIIFKKSDVWHPYAEYEWIIEAGYADYQSYNTENSVPSLKWTEAGRKWIIEHIEEWKLNA